jgi:hypothetical protein
VPGGQLVRFTGLALQGRAELAHGLQHAERRLVSVRLGLHQRVVDERLQGGQHRGDRERVVGHDRSGRAQGEGAGEDGDSPEHGLLLGRQQRVAPPDRGLHRLVSRRHPTLGAPEEVPELVIDLCRRERPAVRGGQLQRQGDAIEACADGGHVGHVAVGEAEVLAHHRRPLGEQSDGIALCRGTDARALVGRQQ